MKTAPSWSSGPVKMDRGDDQIGVAVAIDVTRGCRRICPARDLAMFPSMATSATSFNGNDLGARDPATPTIGTRRSLPRRLQRFRTIRAGADVGVAVPVEIADPPKRYPSWIVEWGFGLPSMTVSAASTSDALGFAVDTRKSPPWKITTMPSPDERGCILHPQPRSRTIMSLYPSPLTSPAPMESGKGRDGHISLDQGIARRPPVAGDGLLAIPVAPPWKTGKAPL